MVVATAVAGLALSACSDSTGSKAHSTPAAVAISSGDGQVGTPGSPLPAPIAATVTNAQGNPIGGAVVSFSVTRGDGSVASTSVTSDNSGVARTQWTLGNGAVRQEVKVSAGAVAQTATATVDTTRSLFLLPSADTVNVGDTIRVGLYAGTAGLGGESRGAIQESVTNTIPIAATQLWPVYYTYAGDDIEIAQPKAAVLDFVTSSPTNGATRQRYLLVMYKANANGAGKDVKFTHSATGFFGARTFNDLLSRVSVVGAVVHIRGAAQ